MKILRKTLSLSAVIVIMLFAACKKSVPKQIKYIPKDASFVFAANAKRLNDKLTDSKVSVDSLIKSAMVASKTVPADIKKWEDVKNSGIDFQSDLFGFYQSKGSMMTGTTNVFGAVAALSSASKFEEYLKKQQPGVVIKKASGGYSEAALSESCVAGWNNDVLIIAGMVNTARFGQDEDTARGNAAVSQQLATLFAMKEDESIASQAPFKEFVKEKGDFLIWSNSSAMLSTVPMLGMTKISDLLKDTYSGGVINFENGKVEADYTYYPGKALADMLKKYGGPTIDMAMIEKYPSNNVDGFMALSFNPAFIAEIIRFIGLEGTANQFLTNVGFTVEDITKAFKGDFAFVLSDLAVEEKPNPMFPEEKDTKPSFKFIFNAKVGDKASYDKVRSALAAKGMLVQTGTSYVPAGNSEMPIVLEDKNIYAASDSAILNTYKGGSGKIMVAGDALSRAKGNPFAGYIDIAKILNVIPVDSAGTAVMNAAKATFKDAYFSAENYSGNTSKGHFELRTGNEKENSLATILKFSSLAVGEVGKAHQARQAAWDQDVTADSTAVTVDTAAMSH